MDLVNVPKNNKTKQKKQHKIVGTLEITAILLKAFPLIKVTVCEAKMWPLGLETRILAQGLMQVAGLTTPLPILEKGIVSTLSVTLLCLKL